MAQQYSTCLKSLSEELPTGSVGEHLPRVYWGGEEAVGEHLPR